MMYVYPYKAGSRSARGLAKGLGARRIKRSGSRFIPSPNKTIINWGCSSIPYQYNVCNVLNKPNNVNLAANKLNFFRFCPQEILVEWCDSKDHVINSLTGGDSVEWIARTLLSANSGRGIELVKGNKDPEEIPDAPLYTKFLNKTHEYRVHVLKGSVLDVQQKKRKRDFPEENRCSVVLNHGNGYVFARNDVQAPDKVVGVSLLAVESLGLDFGACDVIYKEDTEESYVLEVNTAPGLTGTTLENYVRAFRGL